MQVFEIQSLFIIALCQIDDIPGVWVVRGYLNT